MGLTSGLLFFISYAKTYKVKEVSPGQHGLFGNRTVHAGDDGGLLLADQRQQFFHQQPMFWAYSFICR
jgi:hypothetical protein